MMSATVRDRCHPSATLFIGGRVAAKSAKSLLQNLYLPPLP